MPDPRHWYGGDLEVSPTGDVAISDGIDLANQRIVRRLMTTLGGYIWHPEYGASVPQRIGDVRDDDIIRSVINSQIFLEAAVARVPEPSIAITPMLNGVFVAITYTDALTGRAVDLQFEVEG